MDWVEIYEAHTPYEWAMQKMLMLVDPWGDVVLDMGGEMAGLGFAEIDPVRTASVRGQLPSLANRRNIAI